ncbi:putative 2OG-Fe(II) oxygenase, partial [Pseudomonas petrae]
MKVEGCLSAGLSHTVKPSSGTFLTFTSWLIHAVNRYQGSGSRKSVAVNFAVQRPPTVNYLLTILRLLQY